MNKKQKTKKGENKTYNTAFHIGARATLEFLANEGFIDPSIVAWLLEEKYIEDIKKNDWK